MPLEKIKAVRANRVTVFVDGRPRTLAKGEEAEVDPTRAKSLVEAGVAEFVGKESAARGQRRIDTRLNLSRGPVPADVPDPDDSGKRVIPARSPVRPPRSGEGSARPAQATGPAPRKSEDKK